MRSEGTFCQAAAGVLNQRHCLLQNRGGLSMPRKIEKDVLGLIFEITGGKIDRKPKTPDWLRRPGMIECGKRWHLICQIYRELTGLQLPEIMPTRERRNIDGILKCGSSERIVEVDESQHFNHYRAATLRFYPKELRLAFDRETWIAHSQSEPKPKHGGWAQTKSPLFPCAGGRHRQRAFRDALSDILPLDHGFKPTLRIADFEVKSWIGTERAREHTEDLLKRKGVAEIDSRR
jgi:hypothetical protein